MEKAFSELNLCLESLNQFLSQKYDPLEHYEIIDLLQRIYELLAATGNNLIINISPSKIYCLHCYNEIPIKEIDSSIHLSCNPYHCFCSTHCFRRHALLCTDSKLIDLDYVRCPACLTSIDISHTCDAFDGNLPQIYEEYKKEQIATFKCLICLTNYEIEEGITLDCDHRCNQKLKCPLCPQPISSTPLNIKFL
ncbi:unnamed protein product [Blepharisma stoltei]|uniref:RING-type domain-containing protein n=1 Tax=Blepharisma stoltei TaxID=1481888 RepID=A0AAU9JUV2_9CILI|nr:unnamed protein product [Blepharisma stoltei]